MSTPLKLGIALAILIGFLHASGELVLRFMLDTGPSESRIVTWAWARRS